ncbi:hypothetical protein OESDEN_23223 [Oesophagostomum dentatum]|uniref:Uncharacterized protein n=1 Tax=Oesophagostomum dentatum TaxID=61180 RepID=A0A0B1S123_OESDE|nr:hypothetical protein OESDEN_23223 [Oesophagostomum dentatum]
MASLAEIAHDRIHNQKWFTARVLKVLANASGWDEEMLAKGVAAALFLLLTRNGSWMVCNSILVIIPMLLIYAFPDEKPPPENMIVYWYVCFLLPV